MTERSVAPRTLAGGAGPRPERLRILLIEDDEGDAFLVRELLEETGAPFELAVATSLREATPLMRGIQCVLLDLGLPDAEGIDGLRRLLAMAGNAAVCVLTGRSDEHLGVAAVAEGAQDYLVKGQVDGVLLVRALRYAVERKRSDESARRLREVELRQAESARLERGLLPQPLMETTRVAVHTFYRSGRALGLLGGDFFDVVQVGEDRLQVIVGDVCGHSVDEAALGVELRVAWRALVLAGVADDRILPALEQVLMTERRAREVFATVASVVLDLAGNAGTVRLAGHPPPVLLSGGRAVPVTAKTGIVLGVKPSPTPISEVEFHSSDWSLLLYTDGLIEGRTGVGNERLDVSGLCALLDEPAARQVPLAALPAWLVGRAEQGNGGPLADDVAMLLISRGGWPVTLFRLRDWTLRQRAAALVILVSVVLGALTVVAALTAAASNDHLDDLLNRTGPMRTAGQFLATAYVNQETGVRGYAISANPDNLVPYTQGLKDEEAQIAAIDGVLAKGGGNAQIRADLQTVRERAAAWRTQVAEPVIATSTARGKEAGQAQIEAANTAYFDQLRVAVGTLQADVLTVRNRVAGEASQTGKTLVSVMIAAAAIIILAGAALLLLLDRVVSRPVVELAAQVREVAAGDYDRHIRSDGSPELRSLAADVDGMRQQIAAELSEVREARSQVEWINEQLKVQAEELTRSNRDLEQFAYVASHDLQEPLRKVASFCQLLQRRYAGQLDDRADQYIAFAVDGAQRMQRLINDLLAFSRIGRLTAGFTEVDLNRVLSDVRSQLEARAGDDAEIVWADLPAVEGEEPLLTTLFMNLIGNSLKFRRPDVPPVITISAERDGDEWRITVRDNGIGIEPEFADKVFVIFQRLHARDAYEGTGIGLAIVKKIVEYHGGRIWLDLDVEDGTSINFTLPVPAGIPVGSSPRKEVAA